MVGEHHGFMFRGSKVPSRRYQHGGKSSTFALMPTCVGPKTVLELNHASKLAVKRMSPFSKTSTCSTTYRAEV